MTAAPVTTPTRLPNLPSITDRAAVARAARALTDGAVLGHGFANFYVITARGDEATVRRVNQMKGRPPGQAGSITAAPRDLTEPWDLTALPDGLDPRRLHRLLNAFFGLGPFGFRAPAADAVPDHLTVTDRGVRTAQVIAPGYDCPSNRLLLRARRACGGDLLYVTSANRSRHLTGADDSPAHWRADGLVAEFGREAGFTLLPHADEAAARKTYPLHLPMSTTILGLHRVLRVPGDPRPHLPLERHGSLPAEAVREVLAAHGFGMVLGAGAERRLELRDYADGLADR